MTLWGGGVVISWTYHIRYLGPIIANGVSKYKAIRVEGAGSDWLLHGIRVLNIR